MPDWLERINYYRAMAKLSSVKEDPETSASNAKHARYVMLNYGDTIRNGGAILGGDDLEEAADKPGYSTDGAAVARNSQDSYGCGQFSAANQIDNFMASPFHRLAILSPDLDRAGLGSYVDSNCWVATIRLFVPLSNPKVFDQPIEFPPDGATVPLGAIPGESARSAFKLPRLHRARRASHNSSTRTPDPRPAFRSLVAGERKSDRELCLRQCNVCPSKRFRSGICPQDFAGPRRDSVDSAEPAEDRNYVHSIHNRARTDL